MKLETNDLLERSIGLSITSLILVLSLISANIASVWSLDYDARSQTLIIPNAQRSTVDESVTTFKFSGRNICNWDVGKYGRCLDIWGKGVTKGDGINANGGFETYRGKPVDLNKGKWLQLGRGQWLAIDLLSVTEKQIKFEANSGTGIVFIDLTKGNSENSGKVCAYGPLIAVQKAEDAVCVENAHVVIGKTGK